jgi:predicted DNA-binding transcriptional regulator AlpA
MAEQQQSTNPNRRIISEREAAQIRGVSEDTLRRNSERGGKPTRVRVSPRRIGYWYDEVIGDR